MNQQLTFLEPIEPQLADATGNIATAQRYIGMYEKLSVHPNTNLSSYLSPMQAYKELGIVRDANDITEILEPLPPPQGTYHTIVIDPPWEVWKMLAKVGADRVFADLFGADVG